MARGVIGSTPAGGRIRKARERTEFGRGFAFCLLQFTFHEDQLTEGLRHLTPEQATKSWADAAYDHLKDLRQPHSLSRLYFVQAAAIRDRLAQGKVDALTPGEARSLIADARALLQVMGSPQTIEAAIAADRRVGLTAMRGTITTCEGPVKTHEEKK